MYICTINYQYYIFIELDVLFSFLWLKIYKALAKNGGFVANEIYFNIFVTFLNLFRLNGYE